MSESLNFFGLYSDSEHSDESGSDVGRRKKTPKTREESIPQQPSTSGMNNVSEEDEVTVNPDDFEDLVLPSDPLVDLNPKRKNAPSEEEPASKRVKNSEGCFKFEVSLRKGEKLLKLLGTGVGSSEAKPPRTSMLVIRPPLIA
jgi:hypothetical protein